MKEDAVLIEPQKSGLSLNLSEIWDYRELVLFLAYRELSIRYKQTLIGIGWAVLQPVLAMVVFSLFFGRYAGLPSEGLPYPVFCLAGLVFWQLFSNSITGASNSLVGSANLLTKIYFPRVIIPLASLIPPLIDASIALALFAGLLAYYGILPTMNLAYLPIFVALALLLSLGVGLWLSALHVRFRDVRFAVPFLIQVWMFASPVVYSTQLVPERWRVLYGVNPMAGIIECVRWSIFSTTQAPWPMAAVSAGVTLAIVLTGILFFRSVEETFADIV